MKKNNIYRADPALNHNLSITLIGCGGTGALVLQGLAIICNNLYAAGRQSDINVRAYDGDNVSIANVGRQPFHPLEIGKNKAVCLVNRLNLCNGLNFEAIPQFVTEQSVFNRGRLNLIIACVDSRAARRKIKHAILEMTIPGVYYLDCGNDKKSGQVLIGCTNRNSDYGLPMPWDICPDLVSNAPEDNTPSCSLAEALNSQDLMVNRFAAMIALELVWQLLRYNTLHNQGAFFDCRKLKMTPVGIRPQNTQKSTKE
ncbi:MAG: PRTRC system ThiF family protein [Victivallales bacterium]|nr:PRTRC system ThiF family protein [Victivallales bacterium]